MPAEMMEKYCVRFRIGHLKAGSQPKFDCHAVAFMRLVGTSGVAIADGFHDLNLFSVSYPVFVHLGCATISILFTRVYV